jgi:hypothetical protein
MTEVIDAISNKTEDYGFFPGYSHLLFPVSFLERPMRISLEVDILAPANSQGSHLGSRFSTHWTS